MMQSILGEPDNEYIYILRRCNAALRLHARCYFYQGQLHMAARMCAAMRDVSDRGVHSGYMEAMLLNTPLPDDPNLIVSDEAMYRSSTSEGM